MKLQPDAQSPLQKRSSAFIDRLFARWISDTVLEARASTPTAADKSGEKGEPEAASINS